MSIYDIPEVDLTPPNLPEGEQKYPICSCCKELIKDKHYYFINDEDFCQECLDQNFKLRTEDFPQW